MSTFSREFLSGATGGSGIGVSSSTPIHTVPSTKWDEIWLYAVNNHASTEYVCTLSMPGNDIRTTISASSGLVLILPGITLASDQTITASSNAPSTQIVIYGFVNRITN